MREPVDTRPATVPARLTLSASPPRRILGAVVILVSLLGRSVPAAAGARIVVVHPFPTDGFMEELFHRLRGELQVHAFSVVEDETTRAPSSLQVAESLLERADAEACVFLGQHGETSVVQLWVAATIRAPVLLEAVAFQRTSDAPTVLAVRAVDLLTLALSAKPPPVAGVGIAPTAAGSAVAQSPPAVSVDVALGADVGLGAVAQWSAFGGALGPDLLVQVGRPGRRLSWAAHLAGPLVGAHQDTATASVKLVQGFALGEADVVVSRWKRLTLCLGAGGGIFYLRAVGTVPNGISSIVPGTDHGLGFAGSVAGEVGVAISSRVSFVAVVKALVFVPPMHVRVGYEAVDYGWVSPVAGLGVRFAL